MSKDEALRMALEALEKLFGIPDMRTGENGGDVAVWRLGGSYRTQQAITAIKEALAQPEREWIDLSQEEIMQIWDKTIKYASTEIRIIDFARSILKAAQEKNT